jgi:hypothetical protein
VPAVLSVPTSSGAVTVEAMVRSRGRWRTARCSFPALFLFFDRGTTAGTIFDGHAMLPLTTHCERHSRIHEQYVLAEYFAYRLFNALTPASLRVRLARIHYRDARRPERALTRYAFFIEHFETLGARLGARVAEDKRFEPAAADPLELGRLELFQLMIGNTDWSVVYGHNVVVLERTSGPPIAVPYDFDYSGLVDADYAVPSPKLRLRDVRQRLFRGFCRPDAVWDALLTELEQAWPKFETMAAEVPGWDRARRGRAWAYLAQFHRPGTARDGIVAAIAESCRTLER